MKDFTMGSGTKNYCVKELLGKVCNRSWSKKWKDLIFAFFTILLFLPLNQVLAQNIQGVAPVLTPPGGMEIDGNAYAQSAGDWESDLANEAAGLFLSTLTPDDFDNGSPEFLFDPAYRETSFFYRDDISNNDPTIFTSSNKIDDDPTTYTWGSGSSPNKNEIQTVAVHFTHGDPTHPNGNNTTAEDLWIIFAADRQVTNGSSYIDFELLQNSLTMTGLEAGSGSFASEGPDGGRTIGDLLITIEFRVGGDQANVVIRQWQAVDGGYEYVLFNNYAENTIFGSINTTETEVPWSVYFTDPLESGLYLYEVNQWAEGAVNLSYYFGNDNPCFDISTMFVRTRTSGSSGTSELKDFPRLEQLTLDLTQDITVTDPEPVCSPATVDLTAEGITSGCTGTLSYWMDADATIPVNDPTAVGDGTYYIKCTSNDNEECFDIEAVNVTVDTTPDITVTDPDAVCAPDTVDITGAASGCGEGFTLSYWLDEDATMSLDTPSAVAESGTYYIKCTNDDNENCYEIEPVEVTVSDTPDITVTDPDAVCTPGTVDITGAASGCGEGFTLSYWLDEEATMSLDTPSAVAESGTYYIKCTNDDNENCYEIEPVVVTVDTTPDITVTDPDAVCAPDTVDITGAASGCGEGFTLSYWLDEGATMSLDTPSAVVESGTYYIKCTNDDNENCYEIEPVEVTVSDTPDITVTDPDAVCTPGTVDITGATSGCGEGFTLSYWLDEDATMSLDTPSAVAESGTYYIKCTNDDNENCYEIEPVVVTVDTTPDITVTDPDTVCAPDTVDITGAASGCGEGFTLSYWLDEGATMSLDTPSAISESGTYYIKCTNDSNANCYEVEPVVVTISDSPDITVTDPDAACSPDMVDITGAASGCGEGYTLTYWNDEEATDAVGDPTALGEGTYYIKCTNDSNSECFDIEPVNVTVDDTPSISITNPDPVCDPETVDLTSDGIVAGCTGTLSYWTDSGATTAVPDPTSVGGGTYYIKCTNDNNENCYDIKQVIITANDVPDIMVTDPDPVCSPETVDITQASSGCGDDSTLSYWTDSGATMELANPSAVAVSGTYYIKCTNDENPNCYEIEEVVVTISDTPDITVINPDSVCSPETVDITGAASGCGEGFTLTYWNDAGATSTLANPSAVAVSGTYYIKCTNDANSDCYDIEPVVVTIEICAQEGCTLGYWKNHTDRWCDEYSTCDFYGDVFMNAPSELADLTLLEALNLKGGGIYNLGRQSVAALLNACSPDVQFYYGTTQQVIDYVNANFMNAGYAGGYLDGLNQAGCPLGGSRATTAPSDDCPAPSSASSSVEVGFSVSPVPFKDNLNIRYEFDYESTANIQIFDIVGNLVKSLSVPNAKAGMNTTINADFVRGQQMYIIKVVTDRDTFTQSVVSGK